MKHLTEIKTCFTHNVGAHFVYRSIVILLDNKSIIYIYTCIRIVNCIIDHHYPFLYFLLLLYCRELNSASSFNKVTLKLGKMTDLLRSNIDKMSILC